MARPWPVPGLGVPFSCLSGRNYLPIGPFTPCITPVCPLYAPCIEYACSWPAGGFEWLWPADQGSKLKVRSSEFSVSHKSSEYNSPPEPPGCWSGGTLDIPWTHPGTIDPPQTAVFDQRGLSKSLSGGAAIPKGSSKSHVQPQGATFCAQQGAHEIISPERAPAGLPEWLLEFEPTLMTPFVSSVICGSAWSFLREPIEHVGGWLREGHHVPDPKLYGARS